MQKGANFCTTLLFFYHTSDWLNQQNLPKLQVAVYLFIFNRSSTFLSTKSLPSLNTIEILCGEHWKIGSFSCLCYDCCDWLKCFNTKETTFQKRFKYILFHKPAFHRLLNSWSENTRFNVGKAYCRRTIENAVVIQIIT